MNFLHLVVEHEDGVRVDQAHDAEEKALLEAALLERGAAVAELERVDGVDALLQVERRDHLDRLVRHHVALRHAVQRLREEVAQLGRLVVQDLNLGPPRQPLLRDDLMDGAHQHLRTR